MNPPNRASDAAPLFEPLEPRLLLDASPFLVGGFAERQTYDLGPPAQPWAVTAGDFNGDGRLDLAATIVRVGGDPSVSVLYGQPDGTLGARQDFPSPYGLYGIVAADFTGDGRLDLAVSNTVPHTVSLFPGQANGQFGPYEEFDVGYAPWGMVAGDFNGDDRLDLAVANATGGTVSVLYGQAHGSLGGRLDVDAGGDPRQIVADDFDGDDFLDLAVTRRDDDVVSVLYGLPGGGFGDRRDFGVGMDPLGIVARDFDRDGRLDLAVANTGAGDGVSLLYGKADRDFRRQDVYAGRQEWQGPWGITAGDFDRDGRLDLALACQFHTVNVLYGQAAGGFGRPETMASGHAYESIIAEDFDGDGRLDLALPNPYDYAVSVLHGQPRAGFRGRQDFDVGDDPEHLAVGDFDRDDHLDLVVTNWGDDTVSVLFGEGDGLFGNREDTAVGLEPWDVVVADFDEDEWLDLAVTNEGDNTVTVLYGRPEGGFGDTQVLAVGDWPRGIVAGHFDADGRLDLAVTNSHSGFVSVLYGQTEGGFGRRRDFQSGFLCWDIAAEDLNGDDRLDLAVTPGESTSVGVLYGQPGGGFADAQIFDVEYYPRGIGIGDFNGDERFDLAVVNPWNAAVSVLYGQGGGGLGGLEHVEMEMEARYLAVDDFDDDGSDDVAVTNHFGHAYIPGMFQGTISVLYGGSGVGLGRREDYHVGGEGDDGPTGIASGDLDGDGRLDLVVANDDSNTVRVLLGHDRDAPEDRLWAGDVDDRWEHGENWSPEVTPGTATVAVFDSPADHEPVLYANQRVAGLDFCTPGWTLSCNDHTLTVGEGGVTFAGAGAPTSTIDLGTGNCISDYEAGASSLAEVTALIATGRNGGAWDGFGITSSAAAADPRGLTAVGVIDNGDTETGIGGLTTFAGVPVDETSVLAAYTWWGDINLDGVVDSNDYDRIDTNYSLWIKEGRVPAGGFRWAVGDLDYDNMIDSNDYDRIDNAFALQDGPAAAGGAASVAGPDPLPLVASSPKASDLTEWPDVALLAGPSERQPAWQPAPGPADLLPALAPVSAASDAAPVDGFATALVAESANSAVLTAWPPPALRPVAEADRAAAGDLLDPLALPALDIRL